MVHVIRKLLHSALIQYVLQKLLHFALTFLLHFASMLLHFALVLHFATFLIASRVNIAFCGDYYILWRNNAVYYFQISLFIPEIFKFFKYAN